MKKPVVLIIMDGIGIGKAGSGNAYSLAKHPNLDKLFKIYGQKADCTAVQ